MDRQLMNAAAALVLSLFPNAATARYTFDPVDLPADFACSNENASGCEAEKRYAAWAARYFDRFDLWYHVLLFDTDVYFRPIEQDVAVVRLASSDQTEVVPPTPNLADAVYTVALRRFSAGWAFAVEMVCVAGPPQMYSTDLDQCAPKLRMVTLVKSDSADEVLPTDPIEVAQMLTKAARWQEADLRSCPGALKKLQTLPAQHGQPLWNEGYVRWMQGAHTAHPEDIVITTDGAGVLVRARSAEDPAGPERGSVSTQVTYRHWNGGAALEWSLAMVQIVQPCLKPATDPAPWDRYAGALTAAKAGSGKVAP